MAGLPRTAGIGRPVLLVMLLAIGAAQPLSAQPSTSKEALAAASVKSVTSLTNGVLTVEYESTNGQFTINTGASHPRPGQRVFFALGTSYISLRDATAAQVFANGCVLGPSSAGATGHTLVPMCAPTITSLGSTGFRATYNVPNWRVVQDVRINGSSLADTNVSHSITVTNTGATTRQYGVRNMWDWQIAANDASFFRTRNPDGAFGSTFATFNNPSFELFEEVDNVSAPTFSIFGTVRGGPLTPAPTPPDQLRYASWGASRSSAWDFTNAGGGSDSSTVHYWGLASPLSLASGQSATFVQYVTTQLSAVANPTPPPNARPVAPISAGAYHACALDANGALRCWGRNDYGQLGDGSTANRNAPVTVSGMASGAIAISPGNFHTCAVAAGGAAKCWGNNAVGQLGSGSAASSSVPVNVSGLGSGVTGIASGANHSCALMASGEVRCWGQNNVGQLGNGSNADSATPVAVSGLSGVVQVTAGSFSTCAVTSGGGVKCWGDNQFGELGDNSLTNRATPVDVVGLSSGVASVSAKRAHACALTTAGGVQCWGDNGKGQLGNGAVGSVSARPVAVSGLASGVAQIAAGFLHSCAIVSQTVRCWGDNQKGALGDGTTTDRPTPVLATGLSGPAIAITADFGYTCAETADGGVNCWGDNTYGQVGDGTVVASTVAQRVLGVGGAGFLDLTPADGLQPAANTRVFPMVVSTSIDAVSATATASIQYRPQDVGQQASVFVFAIAPQSRVVGGQSADVMKIGYARDEKKADTPVACVLAQLNSAGQLAAVSSANLVAYLTGVLSAQGASVSILNGVPVVNVAGATFFVGYGANGTAMLNGGTNRSAVTVPGSLTCEPSRPQTGWWWNPLEDGRGFSVEVRGNNIFFASFLYDVSGRSTWYVSTGPVSLDGSYYSGALLNATGGQTLGGAYPGRPAISTLGNMTLTFHNAASGTLVWPGGTVPIQRFSIVANGLTLPAVAGQPENGWWWNEQEDGRGFFMEWQNGTLDIAGYMYDDAGNPVWYLTVGPIGGSPATRTFSGNWWSYGNGMTLFGPWRQHRQTSSNVAPVTIAFTGPDTALMTLPNGRTTSLKRHRF